MFSFFLVSCSIKTTVLNLNMYWLLIPVHTRESLVTCVFDSDVPSNHSLCIHRTHEINRIYSSNISASRFQLVSSAASLHPAGRVSSQPLRTGVLIPTSPHIICISVSVCTPTSTAPCSSNLLRLSSQSSASRGNSLPWFHHLSLSSPPPSVC